MASLTSFWGSKVRQFRAHLRAQVTPDERAGLDTWTTLPQRALFDSMHLADRRHGLDVVTSLRDEGVTDADLLIAGLVHDAGKGHVGVWPRVAYALGREYGAWIWRVTSLLPGFRATLEVLRLHAETSATLAAAAGCTPRTVELIRWQDAPRDPDFGELLRVADDAN